MLQILARKDSVALWSRACMPLESDYLNIWYLKSFAFIRLRIFHGPIPLLYASIFLPCFLGIAFRRGSPSWHDCCQAQLGNVGLGSAIDRHLIKAVECLDSHHEVRSTDMAAEAGLFRRFLRYGVYISPLTITITLVLEYIVRNDDQSLLGLEIIYPSADFWFEDLNWEEQSPQSLGNFSVNYDDRRGPETALVLDPQNKCRDKWAIRKV